MRFSGGKATFYRCFHDKYEVMSSNYKELLDEFMDLEGPPSYRKWVEGKYGLSADKAADLFYGMMPETLRCYWVS